MAEPERKDLVSFEIKDAEKGEVEAVIATLEVVDREGDVVRKDAIANGAKVKVSSYGHDAVFGAIPVGKGTIVIEGNKAVFKGRMFLNTARGRETFDVLKEMGAEQEWSFGFRVTGSEIPDEEWRGKGADRILTKLDAFEVSPVLIGAGKGTRTLTVKEVTIEAPDPAVAAAAAAEAARVLNEELARVERETKAAIEAKAAADAELRHLIDIEADRFSRMVRRFRVA